MRAGGLLDEASSRALDFAWLRGMLAPASEYGERLFSALVPFRPGEEESATAHASRIAALARALDAAKLDAAREIFRSVPDAATAIARASMGDALADANLLELQRFFDACDRIDTLLVPGGAAACADDATRTCARTLELGRAGRFGFYVADAFDAKLADARASLARAQAEYDAVRGRAAAAVAQALGREIAGSEFIVMRADLQTPLPHGVRVVREAPTYLLCELDADESSLAALERRDAAANAVAAAEEGVRAALSSVIRGHSAALERASQRFGEADVLVAAARYAQAHECVVPRYTAAPALSFEDARFVPLALELEREGRTFTPMSVSLEDMALLTGPNMGGKSVCLRTCGFVALCAAFGIPVPARAATSAIFDELAWLGAGGDDEIGGLLSSFAREVVRLCDVLERPRLRRFAMLDEFARTTTPREGRALLVAVIGRLRALGVVGMAATHLAGVAESAGVRHFAVRGLRGIPEKPATQNLSAALATLAASMDYTIEEVTDRTERRSDAIALAALLGLDHDLIAHAYEELE